MFFIRSTTILYKFYHAPFRASLCDYEGNIQIRIYHVLYFVALKPEQNNDSYWQLIKLHMSM